MFQRSGFTIHADAGEARRRAHPPQSGGRRPTGEPHLPVRRRPDCGVRRGSWHPAGMVAVPGPTAIRTHPAGQRGRICDGCLPRQRAGGRYRGGVRNGDGSRRSGGVAGGEVPGAAVAVKQGQRSPSSSRQTSPVQSATKKPPDKK